jgi:hypothetical protein
MSRRLTQTACFLGARRSAPPHDGRGVVGCTAHARSSSPAENAERRGFHEATRVRTPASGATAPPRTRRNVSGIVTGERWPAPGMVQAIPLAGGRSRASRWIGVLRLAHPGVDAKSKSLSLAGPATGPSR